jgi:hypothetical protein
MTRFLLYPLAALLLLSMHVNAANVIDQNNPSVAGTFCQISTNICGQSFQQDNGNISGAGIYVQPASGSGQVTLSVWETLSRTGAPIASATSGTVSSPYGWVDVFWTPVVTDPTKTYFLYLGSTNSTFFAAQGSHMSNYPDGGGISGGSPSAVWDITFRTYYSTSMPVAAIPEPSTYALMLAGLGFVGFVANRRRKSQAGAIA